ncbi:MAG: hypothetical protein EXR93_02270 [Gemmatimonadetes bacterium]|nr:hypothetical protein [Gemmatimonadota bacterium]
MHRRLHLLLVFSIVGMLAELLLTKHWDGVWQVVPLVLLGAGLVVALVGASTGLTRSLMALFILSGLVGTLLHYKGKLEFALERNQSLSGFALVRETLKGTSPPILAPGAMIAIGLLGLIAGTKQDRAGGRETT